MDVVYTHCGGLDVHKKTGVAGLMIRLEGPEPVPELRPCRTLTTDLLALADWLQQAGCTPVAMESTGGYWRPGYKLLAGPYERLVVHAQHIKAVAGRTTEVTDAAWSAEWLRHGLLRGSFLPAKPHRQVRELTRERRTLVQDHTRARNRWPAVVADAKLKLASVVAAIYGSSAQARLAASLAGQRAGEALADLARGRLRSKRAQLKAALDGRVTAHQSLLLTEHWGALEDWDEASARRSAAIDQRLTAEQAALARLETLPGVGPRAVESLCAEIRPARRRFPRAKPLASWAGRSPGQHASGGKRRSGKPRQGRRWLRQRLIAMVHVASKTKPTDRAAHYRRIAA